MNSEKFLEAMDLIPESYKKEAMDIMSNRSERKRGLRRPVKVLLIAAVMVSLFTVSALAVGSYINSPEQAEKVARQELEKMQALGILSEEFYVSAEPADQVIELPPYDAETYFFGRIWPHRYSVQWYKDEGGYPYTVITQIDTAQGKIMALTVEALPSEDEKPYRQEQGVIPMGYDEEKKEPIMEETTFYYYDNYEDILPEGVTVDEFCTRLNEYWGFNGYSIEPTMDDFYELEDVATPAGDSLVRDLPQGDYYLTVFFEGDQEGVPRYIQTCEFSGYVALIVGTNHAVG